MSTKHYKVCFFFFQAEDGIRDLYVTGVQTCALPIYVVAGDGVHDQGEDEEDEAGGDQRGAVDRVGGRLVELVGDDGGQRVGLAEDRVGDVGGVADDDRHGD